jgi:hypothetical protein
MSPSSPASSRSTGPPTRSARKVDRRRSGSTRDLNSPRTTATDSRCKLPASGSSPTLPGSIFRTERTTVWHASLKIRRLPPSCARRSVVERLFGSQHGADAGERVTGIEPALSAWEPHSAPSWSRLSWEHLASEWPLIARVGPTVWPVHGPVCPPPERALRWLRRRRGQRAGRAARTHLHDRGTRSTMALARRRLRSVPRSRLGPGGRDVPGLVDEGPA